MNGARVVNVSGGGGTSEHHRWLYGVNVIARRLEVHPQSVREVHVLRGSSARRSMVASLAAAAQVPIRDADDATLRRLTGCTAHQGVAALAEPFQYADLSAVVRRTPGPLLFLDQVQDPQNLGALIRTAAAVGMAAVVIPRHGAAVITASVEKAAAGAANDVPICRVANICRSLEALRSRGYWSIALVPRRGRNLFALEMPKQPILVLGGETGMRRLVARTCDFEVSIPLRGPVESLNASVAGAVAMYEMARRVGMLDRG